MTYDEAMKSARAGHRVRVKTMQRGWTVAAIKIKRKKEFFVINPHTGSNYQYRPTDADRASTDWSISS